MNRQLEKSTHFPFPWMEKDEVELASEFDIAAALLKSIDQSESKN